MQGLLRTTPPGLLTQFNFGAKTATLIRGLWCIGSDRSLVYCSSGSLKSALLNRRITRKQFSGVLCRCPGSLASGPSRLSGFVRSSKGFRGVVRMCKDF